MAAMVATDITHFREWLFEKAPKIYREASINGRLSQYKGDT
jgi:hypothetical protein